MRAQDRSIGNTQAAGPEWPHAVVLGGYRTGVVLMRDLVRHGVAVCCVDYNPEQSCFRTVYGQGLLCPNPDEEPDRWLAWMKALGDKYSRKPALICSADIFVTAVADHAEALAESFLFCSSSAATQGLLATKKRQYDMAEEHGLPTPRTRYVRSEEEAAAFGSDARFPCLLKPIHFRDWERFPAGHPLFGQKIALADSLDALLALYRSAAEATPDLMIQEIIEGPDTAKFVYLSCYGRDRNRIGSCVLRELRTTPILFGSASVVEPVIDREVDSLCDGFLRGIGYIGICEIEVKRDSRDGKVRMIEANPRYSVTADAGSYAGVDLAWLHYLDLIGEPVTPVLPKPDSFRHIVLERDSATIVSAWKAGLLSWRELAHSYSPPLAFYDFDLKDRRLTFETTRRVARSIAATLFRSLFPKRRP